MAKPVERPHFGLAAPASKHAHAHGPGARLPLLVECLLIIIFLPADRPEALATTDVVHGVHYATPPPGRRSRWVPIIAFRVTSSASRSSDQPSVPPGRCGTTIYRRSEVESQTLTSTCSSSFTPNSSKTPRGSRTARARYSFDLYQLGDMPIRLSG